MTKPAEHGAVRKHDELTTTEDPAPDADARYFNDDGNKIEDLEFVGARSPDADPDDREK